MEWSKYNHLFKSEKFGYLLYNAETNSFAKLDKSTYSDFEEVKEKKAFEKLDKPYIDQLKAAKVIVEKNDDSFFLKKKMRYYMMNFTSNSLGLAIAPTTGCNFSCSYCYEKNRSPIYMDKDIEDGLFKFINKHNKADFLDITWYGGEPLLGFKSIVRIMDALSKMDNIRVRNHGIITNGYLLDEEKSIFFSKHGLNSIQITIDGDKKSHNQRRNSGGKDSYDTILSNLDVFLNLNKEVVATIRVNVDRSNKNSFLPIYKELRSRWGNRVYVYPAFVNNFTENCNVECNVLNIDERIEFYFKLQEKGEEINIDFFPRLRHSGCGATNLHYYVVGPEGELYKCWNDIGEKNKIVGDVFNNKVHNESVLNHYLVGPSMFDDLECKKCSVFPICDGGCKWMRLKNVNENGAFNLCTHRKDNLDKFLEAHYLKLTSHE